MLSYDGAPEMATWLLKAFAFATAPGARFTAERIVRGTGSFSIIALVKFEAICGLSMTAGEPAVTVIASVTAETFRSASTRVVSASDRRLFFVTGCIPSNWILML